MSYQEIPHPEWCDANHAPRGGHSHALPAVPSELRSLEVEVFQFGAPVVALNEVRQLVDDLYNPIPGQFDTWPVTAFSPELARRVARRLVEAAAIIDGGEVAL